MRSRLFLCAALAGTCLFGSWSSVARAADPKGKKGKTSDSDDKVINKQLQWEDSVMGPDDGKRAELDKIARAQAINKAASEKAAKEKEKADAQAAREKEKADAAPKTTKRGGEVALPSLPDEDSGKGKNREDERDLAQAPDDGCRRAPAAGEARRRQVHRRAAQGRRRQEEAQGLGVGRQGAGRSAGGREAKGRSRQGEEEGGRRRQPAFIGRQGAPDAGDPHQARDPGVGEAGDLVAAGGSADARPPPAEAGRRHHPRHPGGGDRVAAAGSPDPGRCAPAARANLDGRDPQRHRPSSGRSLLRELERSVHPQHAEEERSLRARPTATAAPTTSTT